MISFDRLVKKLCKKPAQIVTLEDIGDIVDPGHGTSAESRRAVYRMTHRLTSTGTLVTIRKGLYYVSDGTPISEVDIIDQHYYAILRKLILFHTGGECFVGHDTALAWLLKDYSLPSVVVIYTQDIRQTIQISPSHMIAFRPVVSWGREGHRDVYPTLRKMTKKVEIEGLPFRAADVELALLDSLLIRTGREEIDISLVKKFLKKHGRFLRREILGSLVSLRYITAVNRLREIARDINDEPLYTMCIEIIRNEGAGCFVAGKLDL